MRPKLQILPTEIIPQVIDEALKLLRSPGVKVGSQEAINLLYSSGAIIEEDTGIVQIPEEIVLDTLDSVPREFSLYSRLGEPVVQYTGDRVHFNPGSSGVRMLDSETMEHRPSQTSDLIQIVLTFWIYLCCGPSLPLGAVAFFSTLEGPDYTILVGQSVRTSKNEVMTRQYITIIMHSTLHTSSVVLILAGQCICIQSNMGVSAGYDKR